jgi:hypothetical protein
MVKSLRIDMNFTKLVIGLFLSIAFAGCSPREEKIDGSIFIVTQGGENFKLGLVTVSVFDQQLIEPYLTKTTADLEKTLKELKEQQESLNEKQNKAVLARDSLEQQYEQAKNLADETLQKIGGTSITRPEFSASDESLLESARKIVAKRDELQKKAKKLDDASQDPYLDPQHSGDAIKAAVDAESELSTYNVNNFDALESVEELKRKKQKVEELQTTWDSLKPAYLKQADEKNRLQQAWQKASDESDSYVKSLATVTGRLEVWPTEQPQVYFNNLPTPQAVTKTDADGKFSLQLSKKGEFILVAQAQRQVSNNTEKYFWLIRVHPDGKPAMQVMLSNDNLITANSSEPPVRFPTP